MSTITTSASPTHSGGQGLWAWFLRSLGLETWFNQAPAAPAGREERVFLSILLPGATSHPADPQAALLTEALAECLAAIRESGGEVARPQAGQLLLSWPTSPGERHALSIFFQLRASVQRRARPAELFGAASLGWVKPRLARGVRQYRGEVLGSMAGILHEGRQLGSPLLISAALHHRLGAGRPFHFQLHVAFELPGHRYPATLYQVGVQGYELWVQGSGFRVQIQTAFMIFNS